ncbi:pentapeptide repeat-containing protein [Sphaerospermopsis torques-reginae ITEP-024]|uniref:Pentapeptide repeat-containing protein n=1 Tax=Sphaerospermopsis torques-reginae ITEP-024 TaxID=984208 RepID=A0ABX8WZH0_9CYAN|nr:pentapeptide repeat-containing protein [Sphaerospermopsis torques-reginae ITEP-024]
MFTVYLCLAKAKLWGANLSRSNLANANLTRANLCGVNLSEANLRGARLHYTKLYGANLKGACYDDSTRFSKGFDPVSHGMRKF